MDYFKLCFICMHVQDDVGVYRVLGLYLQRLGVLYIFPLLEINIK
jgi:hypothetical protein